MVTHEGVERAQLGPAGTESGGCLAHEAADVVSREGHAEELGLEELAGRETEVFGGASGVAEPVLAVTSLAVGVGTGEQEGCLAFFSQEGLQGQHELEVL